MGSPNVIAQSSPVTSAPAPGFLANGALWGALGVVGFSLTLPATRLAVMELDGTLVGLGRAVIAAAVAALLLLVARQPLPPRAVWGQLAVVAAGVVVGFPLFSAWALQHVPSAHGAVIVGLTPAATAVMAVIRAGERPSRGFWLASLLGLIAVLIFAVVQGAGWPVPADGLILIAVALGALGYAEGGRLSRTLGGWQVISWALVLSAPVLAPIVIFSAARHGLSASPTAWACVAYVSLISMYFAFFAWYRGLAIGGVARIGQVQLIQPVLTLLWSALLLGEHISGSMIIASAAVLGCVALTQRSRVAR
jgi:drug/metabolite transporter (DMT)-like permease